ncbi:MAG TPA: hypothetical protein VFV71_02980, partial [Burkholderiales bacterium]|nr:hypothetical protein [Burkholderiales bacterium]
TALGRTRMERELKLDPQANAYGVNMPQMIVLVYGKDNPLPLAQFAIGDLAPDGLSRYVFRVGGGSVVTIANYQVENLDNLIAAVAQQPPASGAAPAKR